MVAQGLCPSGLFFCLSNTAYESIMPMVLLDFINLVIYGDNTI